MSDNTPADSTPAPPRLIYAPPTDTPRAEFDTTMATGDPSERAQTFLGYVHTEEDWKVTENVCFDYLDDTDQNIRRLAILFLGYIPRLHGTVHTWRVIPELGRICRTETDMTLVCTAEDALGDVVTYTNFDIGKRPYARLPWRVSHLAQRAASSHARRAFEKFLSQQDEFDEDVAHAVLVLLRTGSARDACSGFGIATAWCIHTGLRFPRAQVARMASAGVTVGFPTLAWRDLTENTINA